LIAVKPDSLLLFTGRDESVDLVGIRSIRIVRKSKAGSGALYGFLAGAVAGLVANANIGDYFRGSYIVAGAFFGGLGGLIGLVTGALVSSDKTIQLEGKSEEDRARALAYLSGKARMRDYK
jgi:outer membrane lipoprotein SlyB